MERDLPLQLIDEASRQPNGFVYEIDQTMVEGDAYNDAVPPEAIRGAWTVDAHGQLTGEFTANPNYKGTTRDPGPP